MIKHEMDAPPPTAGYASKATRTQVCKVEVFFPFFCLFKIKYNLIFYKGPQIKCIKLCNSQGFNKLEELLNLINSTIILNRSGFQELVRDSIIEYKLIFCKRSQIEFDRLCISQGLNSIN